MYSGNIWLDIWTKMLKLQQASYKKIFFKNLDSQRFNVTSSLGF